MLLYITSVRLVTKDPSMNYNKALALTAGKKGENRTSEQNNRTNFNFLDIKMKKNQEIKCH